MKQVLKADGTCIMAYLLKEKEAILPPFLYYFNEDSFPFSGRMPETLNPAFRRKVKQPIFYK